MSSGRWNAVSRPSDTSEIQKLVQRIGVAQAHDVAEQPAIHFLGDAEAAQQDDATAEGGGVQDGQGRILIEPRAARDRQRAEADDEGGEQRAEEGAPVVQAGDHDGDGDARQQGVGQRADLEGGLFQYDEGAGIAVGETNEQRGEHGALVERVLERFEQPVDHATSFPARGPKVAARLVSENTASTRPKATASRRSMSTSS